MSARKRVLVIIDGPDPDNYILALAASSKFFGMEVVAVIMTGRPVTTEENAPPYAFTPSSSSAVRRDNALHVKGIFSRHGREHIPVFEGLRAPSSTVSHQRHIHERVTDIYDDAHASLEIDGNIDDAVVFLSKLEGPIHVICGGPMTDLAYLMSQPLLHGKLGIVTAQLGMFGFGDVKTISGGRRQFNALTDPTAVHLVLHDYPEPIYMVPTDITKDARHGFDHPRDLEALLQHSTAGKEMAAMYWEAWPHMWEQMGERIYVHDFHPAELMRHLLRLRSIFDGSPPMNRRKVGRYGISRVGIGHVPHVMSEVPRWGEIDLGPIDYDKPLRYLVDRCDTTRHREILAKAVHSEAYVPAGLRRRSGSGSIYNWI